MTRTRSRQNPIRLWITETNYLGGAPYSHLSGMATYETITESKVPGGNNVVHWKTISPITGPRFSCNGAFGVQTHHGDSVPPPQVFPVVYPPDIQPLVERNNSFELITFLADLDGTVAMFTERFWRQLSYGSVNWGLLPFVSDVKSLYNTVRELGSREPEPNRVTVRKTDSGTFSLANDGLEGSWTANILVNGYAVWQTPDFSNVEFALRRMLNEFGVHPDLRTVWDVIPLSFVVDYFLPIGDLLESLRPRGWIDYATTFDGWISYTVEAETTSWFDAGTRALPGFKPIGKGKYRYYRRDRCVYSTPYLTGPREPVHLDRPSLRQLFNTAYLAGLTRGRK